MGNNCLTGDIMEKWQEHYREFTAAHIILVNGETTLQKIEAIDLMIYNLTRISDEMHKAIEKNTTL